MRNVLLLCLLVVSSATGQYDLDGADGNLKVIWKWLALQWKEKYQGVELKNARLSQKLAQLEAKIQECSLSDDDDNDNTGRLRGVEVVKDSSTRENAKFGKLNHSNLQGVVQKRSVTIGLHVVFVQD